MLNRYTGDVPIEFGGKEYLLRYDYAAISALLSEHDKDILKTLFADPDPDKVAKILLIGLKRHHPNVQIDRIYFDSPPLFPIMHKIDQALAYAYFGVEGVTESENNPPDIKKKTKKKIMNLLKRSG